MKQIKFTANFVRVESIHNVKMDVPDNFGDWYEDAQREYIQEWIVRDGWRSVEVDEFDYEEI